MHGYDNIYKVTIFKAGESQPRAPAQNDDW
jgi:hypothetical protein